MKIIHDMTLAKLFLKETVKKNKMSIDFLNRVSDCTIDDREYSKLFYQINSKLS